MSKSADTVRTFCMIQLQILKDRETRLRKEILDCKIQREFLTKTLTDMEDKEDGTAR